MKRWLIILTIFSWVLCISAQENSREKKVKGSYTYEIPKSMSYDQACQAALVKAQNDAIAEAFGLSMIEDNSLFVSNFNGKSDVSFHSTSEGTVRGVWLADESEPVYEKFQENGAHKYERVGIIEPIENLIWDNRFMAVEEGAIGANLGFTTFKKVSGKDFAKGMLIREISSK